MQQDKPKILISSCLLGNPVRYNGGHKRHPYLIHELGQFVEWQPVCPEVAIGLGIPRPTIRLVKKDNKNHLIMPKTGEDYSDDMIAYAKAFVKDFNPHETHGIILKSGSPSCGMRRVKVYNENGCPVQPETGMFAAELLKEKYLVPMEEDGRMNDPTYRENFIYAVYAWKHWCDLLDSGLTKKKLYDFHRIHKYRLMAHNPKGLKALGRSLAESDKRNLAITALLYISKFMEIIKRPASRRRHANTLFHLAGYLKHLLTTPERRKIQQSIEFYRRGEYPLIVPLSFINLYAEKFELDYLLEQAYLNPYPNSLKLMNTI